MPTRAIPDFSHDELTRWDMARGLRNAGINVPMMTRAEMVAALQPKPGQGGIANVGTMPDDQLRDLMDRHGLNYFKMTDDQMRKLWKPIDEKNQAGRPAALFTGDEGRGNGGNRAVPTSPEDRRNMGYAMLQKYMQNPEQFGPHFGINAINAIHAIGPDIELPENSAAHREQERARANWSNAHAGLVPSEIEKNEAIAGHYKAEGENKPILVPPGVEVYQAAKEHGNPATKIATGASEKASNPDATIHMSEGDKIMLQGAWHGMANEMDPEQRKMYQGVIDHIYGKYNTAGPAGAKPPGPGATLRKNPRTGQDVWVGLDGKVIQPTGK